MPPVREISGATSPVTHCLEPIREDLSHDQGLGLVRRLFVSDLRARSRALSRSYHCAINASIGRTLILKESVTAGRYEKLRPIRRSGCCVIKIPCCGESWPKTVNGTIALQFEKSRLMNSAESPAIYGENALFDPRARGQSPRSIYKVLRTPDTSAAATRHRPTFAPQSIVRQRMSANAHPSSQSSGLSSPDHFVFLVAVCYTPPTQNEFDPSVGHSPQIVRRRCQDGLFVHDDCSNHKPDKPKLFFACHPTTIRLATRADHGPFRLLDERIPD